MIKRLWYSLLSNDKPQDKNVIWIDTSNSESFTLKLYRNGGWKPLQVVGTSRDMIERELTGYVTSHYHSYDRIINKPTTLEGYGITDCFNKKEVEKLLDNKVTKVDGMSLTSNNFSNKYKKMLDDLSTSYYNKKNVDNLLNKKQDVISDLKSIREGAKKGNTALQSFTETDPIYLKDKPFIALKSDLLNDNNLVHKEGDEDIKGIKRFEYIRTNNFGIYQEDNNNHSVYIDYHYDESNYLPILHFGSEEDWLTILDNIADPVDDFHAANKHYVDESLATKQNTLTPGNGISIEGNVISSTVAEVVDSIVNAGYLFAGVATPSTNPGTPDAKVFYIAKGKGTYTNFGGLGVTEDEVVILYYDTEWHKVVTGIASQEKLTELEREVNSLSEFKNEYLSIEQGTEDITTSISDVVDGYVTKDGIAGTSATNYKNTGKVAVVEGDIVTFISSQSTTQKSKFAYLCAWDENGNALPSLGLNSVNETTYVVPSSVHFVTLTFNATDYPVNNLCVYITRAVTNVAFPRLDALDAFVEEDSYDAIDYPQVAHIPGYYWSGAINGTASYFHIHLENLKEGDVITFFNVNDLNYAYRFLDAYNGTTRVPSASSNVGAKVVTIPSGVDNIYLSYLNGYSEGNVRIVRVTTSKSLKGLTLPSNVALRKCAASVKTEALQPNTILYLFKHFDNKKNSSLEVYAKFDSFDTITLGHGKYAENVGYTNKVVVDAEKITCYYNGTQNFQVSHGLVISSYIHIIVTRGKRTNARVTINTTSGTFTTEEINLIACRDEIYAVSSSALSDVILSYVAKDLLKDIYLFGDSYTSLIDPSRYPKYLDEVYDCIDNMMMCGFGGVGSKVEIQSLISALSLAKPKYLIWALGMNDADSSSAVNANWLTCYNEVIEHCKRYEIVPIFCTIPNVPTINNSFKNDIVRNSGYRYIDFAKAVNAEDVGSPWYDGMLSSDGIHPTELGAKALAARFITDFPEVMG